MRSTASRSRSTATAATSADWLYVETLRRHPAGAAPRAASARSTTSAAATTHNLQLVDRLCALLDEMRPAGENPAMRAQGHAATPLSRASSPDRPGHDVATRSTRRRSAASSAGRRATTSRAVSPARALVSRPRHVVHRQSSASATAPTPRPKRVANPPPDPCSARPRPRASGS